MKVLQTGAVLLIAALLASGCSSSGRTNPKGFGGYGTGSYGPGIGNDGYGAGGAYGVSGSQPMDDRSGLLAKRIIYFVYDSSEVQPDYLPVIASHANFLAANKGKTVVLEGHADERGSPEYNIALGEQRAQSVAKLMKLQGVGDAQIQIVSFGEEKAVVTGHDENAWQQNRRVEITYLEH